MNNQYKLLEVIEKEVDKIALFLKDKKQYTVFIDKDGNVIRKPDGKIAGFYH